MKKILVLMPNNLGDVIMTIPVLEGIKADNKDSYISFLVESGFEAGLENLPFCDEIIAFPRKSIRDILNTVQWKDAVESVNSIIGKIVLTDFDRIINLCQHEYVSFLVLLMKGKAVSGRYFCREGTSVVEDAWSQYLYAIPFSRKSNNLHAVDVYRRIAGVKTHSGRCTVNILGQEKKSAATALIGKGMDLSGKIMAFQCGAAFGSKIWPLEHFIALGKMLVNQGWQILVTGSPQEACRAYSMKKEIGRNCFTVAGETSFRQSMALCSLAQGCVTGDTALMHSAAGSGVSVYALFGATNPVETGPYGNGHWVFSAACKEKPCFKTQCDNCICMKSILPQTVFNCITDNNSGAYPGCDVYKTVLEKNCDYKLVPITPNAFGYWNPSYTYLTRNAFEAEYCCTVNHENDFAAAEKETVDWLAVVDKMKIRLENYLITKNTTTLKEFELIKISLSRFTGVGEFWTAILNIRLNGISLIDPHSGIEKSLDSCKATIVQISDVVNSLKQSRI
jgi:ADP-heptose:LPS heptosyltransferase